MKNKYLFKKKYQEVEIKHLWFPKPGVHLVATITMLCSLLLAFCVLVSIRCVGKGSTWEASLI